MKYISSHEVLELNDFFKVLSDPTRMRIILLLRNNPLTVGEIAEHLAMEQSAISHQLKVLYGERFVKYEPVGKTRVYEILDDHIYEIINQASAHIRE